jgi:hypothetical protein
LTRWTLTEAPPELGNHRDEPSSAKLPNFFVSPSAPKTTVRGWTLSSAFLTPSSSPAGICMRTTFFGFIIFSMISRVSSLWSKYSINRTSTSYECQSSVRRYSSLSESLASPTWTMVEPLERTDAGTSSVIEPQDHYLGPASTNGLMLTHLKVNSRKSSPRDTVSIQLRACFRTR